MKANPAFDDCQGVNPLFEENTDDQPSLKSTGYTGK
jgi:hypothetical protein